MSALQITAIVLCLIVPTIGWVLLFRQVYRYTRLFRAGAPDHTRTGQPGARTATLLKEFLGHTRMARLPVVSIAHWFTALGFLILFVTLVNAFFQLIWPEFHLPIVSLPPFQWVIELFTWATLIGIIALIVIRQKNHPRSASGEAGRRSRFFGSTWWQAYFVEIIILLVAICILCLRTQEAALVRLTDPDANVWLHFPLTAWLSGIWSPLSEEWLRESIVLVAAIKILISFTWMIVISLTPTMGVAWHRFLAFFNIWFKRHPDRTSLGELQPMYVNGEAVTAENLEDIMESAEDGMDEESEDEMGGLRMGAGHVQDFSWKQLLDFSTCTECGRCQSQCPAWNTDKPLSPKMLMMTLRDHSNEMAPWLTATTEERRDLKEHTRNLATVPLVGDTGYESDRPLGAYDALGPDAIIDSDVLWSCTTCGACVEQCPVDIEHVDAIVDMRRHQVLIESAFPAEFGGLFKNMESKANPWGMAPKMRLDWAKGLEFDVPVVGSDVEDLGSVDYLFWVGCAGAFEDRAKKTTRAVAELLHEADVSFAVLGENEACTGDSARRAGNEILYQMLASQNVEMLNEVGAQKIVVTCAHCFNTLRNEYPQNGGKYEVLHHTQLLNRLVREKRLVPVSRPEEHPGLSSAKQVQSTAPTVTYHDPCYLGRHNNVYAPPRELIGALPGVELTEMPRHGQKSFCCGAGGARMWAEENLGTRVNLNRTAEAVETGADRIAIGCPFCRVMLTDGLTAMQDEGTARAEVEVVDVAQMLLAAVRRGETPDDAPQETAASESAEAPEGAGGRADKGAADTAPPQQDAKAAQEEADEAGGPEFETSDETARAAQEAREQQATGQSAPGTTAQEKPAGMPKGKMSAADALAAMGGGAAAGTASRTDEEPKAADTPSGTAADTASAPAGETAQQKPAGMPKGKMSAADALAMMQGGGAAAPAEQKDETAPATESAPAPAAQDKPASMPKGKMSAADALAMMQGGGAAAPAEQKDETAPATESAPTPAAREKPASIPKGKMSASEALAAMGGGGAATGSAQEQKDEAPAPAAAEPAAQAPAPASESAAPAQSAPAAPKAAAPAQMPKGKMSASEALAMMGAAAPAAAPEEQPQQAPESAPVEAQAAVPAAPEAAPEASAPAAETPASTQTEAPEATDTAATPTTSAPTASSAPASSAPAAPRTPVEMPKGRMSASEALAMMGGAGAAASAPAASQPAESTPEPEPEPVLAEAPQQEAQPVATAVTPQTEEPQAEEPAQVADRQPEPVPSEVPEQQPEPATGEAPTPVPDTPSEPSQPSEPSEVDAPAAASSSTPGRRADAGAWKKLVEAAGGKPISSSEALKILEG